MLNKDVITAIEKAPVSEGLALFAAHYPDQVVFSSSLGQEDQVLTDIIFRNRLPVKIFTIDTGRLFNETYELLERTVARYQQPVSVYFPDPAGVEDYVNEKGINAFYNSVEDRKSCCYIRKVEPLNRALAGARVWVTGLRSGQSAGRKELPMVEWDDQRELYKYNPLLHWSLEDILSYVDQEQVPCNRLHDQGFISIGCAPCTRAIQPGEDPRAGRWWWETSQKECGLHVKKALETGG